LRDYSKVLKERKRLLGLGGPVLISLAQATQRVPHPSRILRINRLSFRPTCPMIRD